MSQPPWLTLLVFWPLLAALVLPVIRDQAPARRLALAATLVELALAVVVTALYAGPGPGPLLTEEAAWIPRPGHPLPADARRVEPALRGPDRRDRRVLRAGRLARAGDTDRTAPRPGFGLAVHGPGHLPGRGPVFVHAVLGGPNHPGLLPHRAVRPRRPGAHGAEVLPFFGHGRPAFLRGRDRPGDSFRPRPPGGADFFPDRPGPGSTSPRARRAGCFSAFWPPSPSRFPWCRSTPGCPTPTPTRPRPAASSWPDCC